MRRLLSIILLAAAILPASARSERLSVMTFNVSGQAVDEGGDHSWEARKKACMKAIKKYDPDVIFLQDAYSYHKAYLMKEFPKHTLVDRSAKPGQVDQEIKNNENPVMFRADRFELLDYGSFWLNEDQEEDAPGWDASSARNVTWMKLRYKKSGLMFFCFNTRFDEGGEASFRRGGELIVDKVKEIAGDDAVVFLGGDFCLSSSDRLLSTMTAYLKDANHLMKSPDTRASFNGYGKPGDKMPWPDHIFCRKAKPVTYEVVDSRKFGTRYISLHYPIYAEFDIAIPKG